MKYEYKNFLLFYSKRLSSEEKLFIIEENSKCVICQESYEETFTVSPIAFLPKCGHFFHAECLCRWFIQQSQQYQENSCPTCREVVVRCGVKKIPQINIIHIRNTVVEVNDRAIDNVETNYPITSFNQIIIR